MLSEQGALWSNWGARGSSHVVQCRRRPRLPVKWRQACRVPPVPSNDANREHLWACSAAPEAHARHHLLGTPLRHRVSGVFSHFSSPLVWWSGLVWAKAAVYQCGLSQDTVTTAKRRKINFPQQRQIVWALGANLFLKVPSALQLKITI